MESTNKKHNRTLSLFSKVVAVLWKSLAGTNCCQLQVDMTDSSRWRDVTITRTGDWIWTGRSSLLEEMVFCSSDGSMQQTRTSSLRPQRLQTHFSFMSAVRKRNLTNLSLSCSATIKKQEAMQFVLPNVTFSRHCCYDGGSRTSGICVTPLAGGASLCFSETSRLSHPYVTMAPSS